MIVFEQGIQNGQITHFFYIRDSSDLTVDCLYLSGGGIADGYRGIKRLIVSGIVMNQIFDREYIDFAEQPGSLFTDTFDSVDRNCITHKRPPENKLRVC